MPANQQVADECDLVFITTPDTVISEVAQSVNWSGHHMVVHTSGAGDISLLSSAAESGAFTGVFHPLQALSDKTGQSGFAASTTISIEAGGSLLQLLRKMACDLGASPVVLKPGFRTLYHASAVLLSNYTVTLVHLAASLWQEYGYSQDEALIALLPLLDGTIQNLHGCSPSDALTGPVQRADFQTVANHLSALDSLDLDLASVYRILGCQTVKLALQNGSLSADQATRFLQLFKEKETTSANINA
jgi:predicted short-subunit dehydrogenase-like oxidoreductase (DUF2520 family)